MYNVQNFDSVLNRAIEDQMLFKALHAPHPNIFQPLVLKLSNAANEGDLCKLLKCLLTGL
jgi:hypothetical protein